MKIVLLEKKALGDNLDFSGLDQIGDVEYYEMSNEEETSERIADADVVIVNKVQMDEKTMAGARNLKFVAEIATGFNNIDLAYCRQRGIGVSNVPGYSTPTVAQHTFALYFAVSEHLSRYDTLVKSGDYYRSNSFCYMPYSFNELFGKTWGIIGLGSIGREAAKIAEAFGCRVIYYSASGRTYDSPYEKVDFDELLSRSDVISIHAPLNEKTKHLMNLEAFGKMKKSAILINVGRGPIVDENALAEALNKGMIAGAGLDVFESEPLTDQSALILKAPSEKIIMTPHIAWASCEARQRLVDMNTENILAWMNGERKNRVD